MYAHSKGGGRQKKRREFISYFYREMKVMCIAGELVTLLTFTYSKSAIINGHKWTEKRCTGKSSEA